MPAAMLYGTGVRCRTRARRVALSKLECACADCTLLDYHEEDVPQVKKEGRRDAIISAAFELFSRKGYTTTTMSEIARAAHMTVANLYVYFDSKLLILYEIYAPWLYERLETLRTETLALKVPRARVRRLLLGLWSDIPAADHSFANALIEALAVAPADMGKPVKLLASVESFVTELLLEVLPTSRVDLVRNGDLSHVLWMAFDGFVINQRIGDVRNIERTATLITNLLLGEFGT